LVPFLKYFGLSLSTSLSAVLNAAMLLYFLKGRFQIEFSENFKGKIYSQLIASAVTGFSLRLIANQYWTSELGGKSTKWLIYGGFFTIAVVMFFSVTVICLSFIRHKHWKLWRKEAWE
jgi:peptidoglycan biosynthesis protein MviN/MurJ (putative lipid II flippase)